MIPLTHTLYIFLIACLFIFSAVFIYGRISFKKGEEEKARKLTFFSLLALFLVFFATLSLYLFPILFRSEQVIIHFSDIPSELQIKSPPFPSDPVFEFEGYPFVGFWELRKKESIPEMTVYLVFCQNEEDYDIIYAGFSEQGESAYNHQQFECWINSCPQPYISFFYIPKEQGIEYGELVKEDINEKKQPICKEEK